MKKLLSKAVFNSKEYFYFQFAGYGYFVDEKLVKYDVEGNATVEFPLVGARIDTAKNTRVIKKGDGNIYFLKIVSYGGSADIKIVNKKGVDFFEKAVYFLKDEQGLSNEIIIYSKTDKVVIEYDSLLDKGLIILHADERTERLPFVTEEEYNKLLKEI